MGCSSSSGGQADAAEATDAIVDHAANHPKDSGKASVDAGLSDAGALTEGDADAAGPPPTPAGMTLEKVADVVILGLTDDGYVIYATGAGVEAGAVTGGVPMMLAAATDARGAPTGQVIHDDVFLWSNTNGAVGTLSVWNHTLSKPTTISTSSILNFAAVSTDSATIAYSDGAAADGSSTAFAGASMSALSSPNTFASGVDTSSSSSCFVGMAFTGTGSSLTLLGTFCSLVDGGVDGTQDLFAYPVTTWTSASLATNITEFSPDTTGNSVAIVLASGQLEVVPLAGGAAIPIDSAAALSASSFVYMSGTDKFVAYNTTAGALKTSTVTASTPQTLVPTSVSAFDGVSKSEDWTLVNNSTDSNTNLPSDLSLASLTMPGMPTSLVKATDMTVVAILGDAFTTDSSYAIYMTEVSQDLGMNNLGSLRAVATAKPTTVLSLAVASVASVSGSAPDLALSGSKLSFVDNFDANRSFGGQVDIHFIDLSTTSPSTIVMKAADPFYAVSFDKKFIVYTISYGGPTDGIYAVPVP